METIGMFEAKTKLSEVCERVAATGTPIVITRRGQPLVRIEPISTRSGPMESVWDRRDRFAARFGPPADDFDIPSQDSQDWRDPLDDAL